MLKMLYGAGADILKMLYDAGADISALNGESKIKMLFWAAQRAHSNVIEDVSYGDTDMNVGNKYGETAMMIASKHGHTHIVKVLCDGGADTNLITRMVQPP